MAEGKTKKERDNARGKLFEKLMAKILEILGYEIARIPNVNYAGMEIDIDGKSIVTHTPLYAECKCYQTEIDSQKLQVFFGKYMTRWLKDRMSQGLFIAIPGINSHARGFYRENIENKSEISIELLEEETILEHIFKANIAPRPESIFRLIPKNLGTPGDWFLLFTDQNSFWVQYLIPKGGGFPTKIMIFDFSLNLISDKKTIDYLSNLWPEFNDYEILRKPPYSPKAKSALHHDIEEIVEVRGSSACFEYQFPAAPQFFVGRKSVLKDFDEFLEAILKKTTSSRGILFEANSGWGKSSTILACVSRLIENGNYALAIDSRSALSSQFILKVLNYTFLKYEKSDEFKDIASKSHTITGFDGVIKDLELIGKNLEKKNKILFIFLDQFENLFYLHEALKRIRDIFLRIIDIRTNILVGFSWKSDLVGLTNEFPYQIRDTIISSSKLISLDTFSKIETDILLNRLAKEVDSPLRKDLRFFLSEFSQGYPWLLKRLCAHVKTQITRGHSQETIAISLLNIEELFDEDIRGLSSPELNSLKRIAKLAPINIQELGEEFETEIVQSLVNRRLLVRIGAKYDLYWDIFRDYLNTGRVPVQENYILRANMRTLIKATKLLVDSGSQLSKNMFLDQINLTIQSFYNILRDMRLLGLVKVENNKIVLTTTFPSEEELFDQSLRDYLKERLQRNRLIWHIQAALDKEGVFGLEKVGNLLEALCPYISAAERTWRSYARIVANWMDAADLAIYDNKSRLLSKITLEASELRDRRISLMRTKKGIEYPSIQFQPIKQVAGKLIEALEQNRRLDMTGIKRSTFSKAVSVLESFGFIIRKTNSIIILPELRDFILDQSQSINLFKKAALKMKSFSVFIQIINENKNKKLTHSELYQELKNKLKVSWKQSTSEVYSKIMIDWARHLNLAPDVYFKKSQQITKTSKKLDEFASKSP